MSGDGLTAEKLATWMSAKQALEIVKTQLGEQFASQALMERLKGGLIFAAAYEHSHQERGGTPERRGIAKIPSQYWGYHTTEQFWITGDVAFRWTKRVNRLNIRVDVRYYRLRFDPAQIDGAFETNALRINSQEQRPQSEPKSNRGAPPREWWADLWIEMFRQIHFGEFTPKRLADLEKRMHDWLHAHNHSASERTIRNAAKKLFDALKERGQ